MELPGFQEKGTKRLAERACWGLRMELWSRVAKDRSSDGSALCPGSQAARLLTRVLSAVHAAKVLGGTLKTNPSPWKQAAGVA